MPTELLERLSLTFGVLIVAGTALSLPLFGFNLRALAGSSLFIKILFWVPIFLVFLGVLYRPALFGIPVLGAILAAAFVEARRVRSSKRLARFYWALFAAAFLHFYLIGALHYQSLQNIFITICLACALSDVAAFFFGKYLGKHKLPEALNNGKSWEGVAGQVVGALAGVLIVNAFVTPVASLWLFVPLGLGSALGDLANSFVKRRLGIKDWGRAIPGHGGFLDRGASLAGSALLTFYFLLVV